MSARPSIAVLVPCLNEARTVGRVVRAFTRSFVNSAPLISKGFDIETELTIKALFRDYKPLTFFGGVGLAFTLLGAGLGVSAVVEYSRSGTVPQTPLDRR